MTTKVKLLASVSLLLVAVFGLAGPANAKSPIPGIKKTAEYRSLLSYVDFLKGKKSTPASSSQKETYRNNLSNRRLKANGKVKKLYNRRLARIESRDDRAERRQIKRTRQTQKRRVAKLNREKGQRINDARATYQAKVNSANAYYSGSIASKVRKKRILRSKLNRTTNPIKREVLVAKIEAIGPKIRKLKAARNNQINQAAGAYQRRVDRVNSSFATRIAGAKRFYKSIVRRIKRDWRETYRRDIRSAKQLRDDQFSLVTNLRNRGSGYIDQMPAPPTR